MSRLEGPRLALRHMTPPTLAIVVLAALLSFDPTLPKAVCALIVIVLCGLIAAVMEEDGGMDDGSGAWPFVAEPPTQITHVETLQHIFNVAAPQRATSDRDEDDRDEREEDRTLLDDIDAG